MHPPENRQAVSFVDRRFLDRGAKTGRGRDTVGVSDRCAQTLRRTSASSRAFDSGRPRGAVPAGPSEAKLVGVDRLRAVTTSRAGHELDLDLIRRSAGALHRGQGADGGHGEDRGSEPDPRPLPQGR